MVKQRESQRIWHGKTPDHSLAASCTIRNLSIDVSSTFDLSVAPFVLHSQLILILNHILHSSSTFNTFTLQFQSFMTSDSLILQPFNVDRSLSCKRKKKTPVQQCISANRCKRTFRLLKIPSKYQTDYVTGEKDTALCVFQKTTLHARLARSSRQEKQKQQQGQPEFLQHNTPPGGDIMYNFCLFRKCNISTLLWFKEVGLHQTQLWPFTKVAAVEQYFRELKLSFSKWGTDIRNGVSSFNETRLLCQSEAKPHKKEENPFLTLLRLERNPFILKGKVSIPPLAPPTFSK